MKLKPPTDVKWTVAKKGEGLSIEYFDKEGNKLIRHKDPTPKSLLGSKAWRHNNPGNLVSNCINPSTYFAPSFSSPRKIKNAPTYNVCHVFNFCDLNKNLAQTT